MPQLTDLFELATLGLSPGEGRRLELSVQIAPLELGGQRYTVPSPVGVVLDVGAMTSHGFSLRLRFTSPLAGPCMRCLTEAAPLVAVDAREIDQPGGGEELDSPYVDCTLLALSTWAHDALSLAAPAQLLCREDCLGLCPQCAANLNEAGPDHHHETAPDPRWAKLRELRLE
jgi:uncharacterized protein